MSTPQPGVRHTETPSEKEDISSNIAARNAIGYFERYERYECQELLAYSSSHWMLSTDDFKLPTEPPSGLISAMPPIAQNSCVFMVPEDPDVAALDLREIHQIIRELTIGIYSLNQLPTVALEANFDQSTSIQLPPAYLDTKVGQVLSNIDYMMKALWHGAYFPKEKRTKFTERWRSNLDVNSNGKPETKKPLITEFTSAGMLDITKDPDYADVYDKLPEEQPGDIEMAEERRFFMSRVEDLSMQITAFQKTVQLHHNLFVLDPDWLVSSVVHILEDKLDQHGYERLNARLQMHQTLVKESLTNKVEVRRQIGLLKLISFLVPFLVAMRKKMKVPELNQLLPPLVGDEIRTEREYPPLILGSDFKCKNFGFHGQYFHLHGGIVIDHETPVPTTPSTSILEEYETITLEASRANSKYLQPDLPLQESYHLPSFEFDGKNYTVFALEFETYYPQVPQKPKWVQIMAEEIAKLKPKRLPLSDIHTHEQFKKYFGYKKAIKYKTLPNGLKAASQRGLTAMFMTLCRKCPASRLSKQDEVGMSLIHYASMWNRPQIITTLILQGIDVNVRRHSLQATGPTALHLSCRCGSLDAVACLLANCANILAADREGWAPIHHAAFFDHEPVIKLLVHKHDTLLELQTRSDMHSTPLLLAASSGALSAVKCLIELGAGITRKDDGGNNMVHLAALRFHTNVLEYFIKWNHPDVHVWKLLVGMMRDKDLRKKDSAVKCLEVLSTSEDDHWTYILEADGVPALVDLLKIDNEELQSVAASVLCNISEHAPVRQSLTKADAGPILIQLLASPVDDIQSRAAIVLADLACVDNNQTAIAGIGGIPPLVNLLDSELEDVLVNAVNAIRVLCDNNQSNQTEVAVNGGLEPLVEFLTISSDMLQAAAAAALAAVSKGHRDNQDAVVGEGAVKPLVDLIKGRNVTVQVKAASALEALANDNADSQKAFLDLDAPKALIKLLKIWSVEVREQGALALWALAGHTTTRQKYIAERIGIQQLIEILLINSEKLQYVGCMAMIALGRENIDNQKKISEEGGIQPLVRLIRSGKASARVLHMAIRTLGTLCVGVAHRNNKVTQRRITEENAMVTLVQLLVNPPNIEIQVEVASTLGCLVLSNADSQERLKEHTDFQFEILLDLLKSPDKDIVLKAGKALTIFAFNNTPQQYAIREAGGIKYSVFQDFIDSDNDFYKCSAAFQIVVLARVIIDRDQVSLTALGVTTLVETLSSKDDNAVILAASLMSSLAHTRAGIPDAMITTGSIEVLVALLKSENELVRGACAVALGYLSFNRTAARMLLVWCRNTPGLYKQMMDNIGKNAKISPEFTDDFRRAKIVGLPSQSLEINGGPPVNPPIKKLGPRPGTTQSFLGLRRYNNRNTNATRAISAPANMQRSLSIQREQTIPAIVAKKQAKAAGEPLRRLTKGSGRPMAKMEEIQVWNIF
ncbi:ankyrin and armadillo repeat-containing protein-like isoform X2 [Lineus longissimus]|uniref:ankyrin and armadillo repeat-containing protein-like isoform X2 n=1 Tax=Lineus longissimus TaxID=88925 RepID=UPI00315C8889